MAEEKEKKGSGGMTVREAGRLLKDRKLSPVELTRAFLNRIEQLDGKLQAYITVLSERALAEARNSEAEILRGEYRGPLHGIPIALKDLYDTAGIRTTASSRVMADRVPAEDATTTARLAAAGSILLGKLAMHEFALGGPDPTCGFPLARNPWNPAHIPGGSSSGSGTAVAAGLCMGSLGSCTGGSIRGPASYCSIVGLKPTYGLVSRYGLVAFASSLDQIGPFAKDVTDTAHVLQAIAGFDPRDSTSVETAIPDYRAALGPDIALVDTLFDLRLTAEMLAAMRAAVPSAARIDVLVNTHANGDHCYGNELVGAGAIVASEACAKEFGEVPPEVLAQLVANADALGPVAGEFVRRAFGPFEFAGITLAHYVNTRSEVDALLERAAKAGARIERPAEVAEWGGYRGYFSDPDGDLWEAACGTSPLAPDGSVDVE